MHVKCEKYPWFRKTSVDWLWQIIVWSSNWFRCCLPCIKNPKTLVSKGWRCVFCPSGGMRVWSRTAVALMSVSRVPWGLNALRFYSAVALSKSRSNRANILKCHFLQSSADSLNSWAAVDLRASGCHWRHWPVIQFFGDVFVWTVAVMNNTHSESSNSFIERTNSLANNLLYRFPSCTVCSFPLLRFVFICLTKKAMIWNHFGGHCVYIKVIIKDLMTSVICVFCLESVTKCGLLALRLQPNFR